MEPKVKRLLSALVIIAAFSSAVFITDSRSNENFIRIAVLKGADSTVVTTRGRFKIVNLVNSETLNQGRVIRKSRVRIHESGIQIGKNIYPARKLRIVSNKVIHVQVGDKYRKYRGFIDIIAQNKGKVLVVNKLEVEQYVRGVLYHEVTDRWPMQAMMAQAVAVRTYAMYQIRRSKKAEYDVTSDIYSQVYGGKTAERYRTNMAAAKTKGQVLLYNGQVLPAYYHSNSGGHTEDVRELWNHDLPPLAAKKDFYSRKAPNAKWKKNFRSQDIQKLLNSNGYNVGLIKGINIVDRTQSGRVKTLEIVTRDENKVRISGKKFRDIVGPNELKSNLYNIKMKGFYFDVTGSGWGHGVGLSQWGAYNMAKKRIDYKKILDFYYPGTDIEKL